MREKPGMWHSWLLLFALLVGLVPEACGDDRLCFESSNCYTVNTTGMTFDNANITCGFKGVLASMKNQQEKEELLTFVSQLQDRRNVDTFWLGLYLPKCTTKDKDLYGFVWVSGGNTTEVNGWKNIPKPSCANKKNCVILETTKNTTNIRPSVTFVWKNVRCKQKLPFICRSSKAKQALASKDIEVVTQSFPDLSKIQTSSSDLYTTHSSITTQHAQISSSTSQVNVSCSTFLSNVTSACSAIISYSCNATQCTCWDLNDSMVLYHIKCNNLMKKSCQQICIQSMNISCSCKDHDTPCREDECTTDLLSSEKTSDSVIDFASSTSAPPNEDDNLLDRLIIPLILGLVAFGILVMLVWGGVQMCIRKRKPKRRKSIAPAPPEGSDTDSTDHSSSEEEEEEDDDEEGERESQDRTEDP